MEPKLANWSWQEIQKVYASFGAYLRELQRHAKIFDIDLPVKFKPGEFVAYPDDKAELVARWIMDINRTNLQLSTLDREIARRNNLIGVMG